MARQLIQGVYFTAARNLDAVNGPGMVAATLTGPGDIRAMDAAASLTNFQNLPTDQTEYSFLYTPVFGFCTAAVQTRTVPGQHSAPYVHMVFSGAHPADPPSDYGFEAVFRTDQYPFPSPRLPYLPANALPSYWNAFEPDEIRPAQLAGLMRQLWQALCPDEILRPLYILPESLPGVWKAQSPSTTLMCLMCSLAELVPPSLRRYLRGTTASAALRPAVRNPFPVRLSEHPNALHLNGLPDFIPEEGDYFGSLCALLSVTYLEDRRNGSRNFQRLLDRMEAAQLAETIGHNDRELVQLAAFCSVTDVFYTRMLDTDIPAALKRLNARLPGLRTRRDFWQAQRNVLSQYRRPRTLRELLPWMEKQNVPETDRKKLLHENYTVNAETFIRQYDACLKTGRYVPELLSFWECVTPGQELPEYGWTGEEIGGLMNGLLQLHGTEGMELSRPDAFYPAYRKELRYWWPYVSAHGEVLNNFCYYFVALMMDENTPLRLTDFDQLSDLSEYTAFWNAVRKVLIWKMCASVQTWEELPPLRELQKIPPDLRHEIFRNSGAAGQLEYLWQKKQRKIHRRGELESWREAGIFLEIPQARADAAAYLEDRLDGLNSVREICAFADSYLPLSNESMEQRLREKINDAAAETVNRDELEELRGAAEKLGGKFPPVLERNLKLLEVVSDLPDCTLAELMDEFPDVQSWPALWADRWRKCVQEQIGKDDSLTRPYAGQIRDAARWIQDTDVKLADNLCDHFFRSVYPDLRDFHTFRQFPEDVPSVYPPGTFSGYPLETPAGYPSGTRSAMRGGTVRKGKDSAYGNSFYGGNRSGTGVYANGGGYSTGDDCFALALERHLHTLLRLASPWDVFRLFQVNPAFPREKYPCPPEPWKRLAPDEQCEILLAIEKNGRDWAVWRTVLHLDVPFCQLLRHLFDLYGAKGLDYDSRVYGENPRMIYGCIRELARQPKAEPSLIRLLRGWGNSRAAPDEHSCQGLVRVLRTLPNAQKYRRYVVNCWRQAFQGTPRAGLLEYCWSETPGADHGESLSAVIPNLNAAQETFPGTADEPFSTADELFSGDTSDEKTISGTAENSGTAEKTDAPDGFTDFPDTLEEADETGETGNIAGEDFLENTSVPANGTDVSPNADVSGQNTGDFPQNADVPNADSFPQNTEEKKFVRPASLRFLLTVDAVVFLIASLIPLAFRVVLSVPLRISMFFHGGSQRIDPDLTGFFTFSPNAGQIHDFLPEPGKEKIKSDPGQSFSSSGK